ncbi:MAG: monofunctional biosynthetic peptidoglycan transglycosylase [Hyphomicrobiales bacterium]|nr:MAG: monofunctional biosynthetic peptidoglycan transglycosylase [Hyphomicrobiales bacterium]
MSPAAGIAEVAQAPAAPFSLRTLLGRLNPRLIVKRTFQILGALVLVYTTLVIGLMVAYRWVDPPMSALMLGQRLSGTQVSQTWMPLDRISPNLQLAVILSEDGRFCTHHGVDWGELKEAVAQSLDGFGARGGSTISMQTVKNLFLWPSKSYVRKAVEIPLAMGTEKIWPKERMLEIYLNIAEWGPGIFGAEAAARYHFGKSAATLTAREASLLAVSLPNPFDRQAGHPGPGTQRLADNIQNRMRRVPNAAACGKPGRPPNRQGVADSRWP